MALNNKVAIVTGGNSGIGKAIALGLAKAGAFIVIDYVADALATSALEVEIAALRERSGAPENSRDPRDAPASRGCSARPWSGRPCRRHSGRETAMCAADR